MAKKKISLNEVSEGAEHNINNNEQEEMTQILFRCTKTQKANIKKKAQSKGQTVSGYIKLLLSDNEAL
jgi:hypothetical protein